VYPEEIIARWLCKDDGRHPDGIYGSDPTHHWELYAEAASEIIKELADRGWFIGSSAEAT